MKHRENSFLEQEPVGKLMMKYAVPCIISLLVAALYNIVDQIFIANASYLGSYGNAANTVVFPLTVVALAIAVMIGDGACAFVSISLGAGRSDEAHRSIGSAVVLCAILSLVVTALYLLFANDILTAFGGTVNAETFKQAQSYFFWITVGMPFYMFGQAMNPIIRSDGSPRFAMVSTLAGAVVNIILDPIFIFVFKWGIINQLMPKQKAALEAAREEYQRILLVNQAEEEMLEAKRLQAKKLAEWGQLFEDAPEAQKRMILAEIIDRIEVRRGYLVTIRFKLTARQFLEPDAEDAGDQKAS